MDNLTGGFISGFPKDPDFISAGEASRRAREAALHPERFASSSDFNDGEVQEKQQDLLMYGEAPSNAAPFGSFQYARDVDSGQRLMTEQAFRGIPLGNVNYDDYDVHDLRWAWIEVDLSAIRHNIAVTRRYLKNRTQLLSIVKADGYGHGAVEVAKTALGAGANRLAVATVPEAMELRNAGITAPLMLLAQPPAASIPLLVENAITPTVYEPDFAVTYGEAADRRGLLAPYHLAINTGMNRIGISAAEAVEFLHQVSFHRALVLEGTFTHFATADAHEHHEFDRQLRRFEDTI